MKRSATWLLLLHQIPPTPPYFRAKVMRRLTQLGALPVKKSAYLLPESSETMEDFQWLAKEIRKEGGEAWIFSARAVAGLSDHELKESFRELRADDYRVLAEEARAYLAELRDGGDEAKTRLAASGRESEWERLQRRHREVAKIDFFGAPHHAELEVIMTAIEKTMSPPKRARDEGPMAGFRGRTWVTRAGVRIDRIASAWLVRRYVDLAAQFVLVDPTTYVPRAGDVRFDMFEGEFTHDGDRCTFEVLLDRAELDDPALRVLAEIVHDVDCKDGKFGRPEAAGVASLVEGLCARVSDDAERLTQGARVFDDLLAAAQAPKKE
jgi:hypothetical protein